MKFARVLHLVTSPPIYILIYTIILNEYNCQHYPTVKSAYFTKGHQTHEETDIHFVFLETLSELYCIQCSMHMDVDRYSVMPVCATNRHTTCITDDDDGDIIMCWIGVIVHRKIKNQQKQHIRNHRSIKQYIAGKHAQLLRLVRTHNQILTSIFYILS